VQLCQRFHWVLSRFPGRAPTSPYPQLELCDPVLPRDSFAVGRVFRFEAFVRENPAQGKRLLDHDRRRWRSGESERTPGNGRFDAPEAVRGFFYIQRSLVCGSRPVDMFSRMGFIKLAIREG